LHRASKCNHRGVIIADRGASKAAMQSNYADHIMDPRPS
jgi:hypothetical protein